MRWIPAFALVTALMLPITACTKSKGVEPQPTPTPKSWKAIQATLDHFKIWTVKAQNAAQDVKLHDQFDGQATRASHTETVTWLANPVRKNDSEILHKDLHLVGYFLKQPDVQVSRSVTIANQINTEPTEWHLTDPAMLLLPASKVLVGDPPPAPSTLDHFDCYLVAGAKAVGKKLTLEDQFDTKRKVKEKITNLEPAFFCAPVSKNGGQILDEQAHLALYDITPQSDLGKNTIKATTRDQFGTLKLEVEKSILIAVPTQKIKWKEEPSQPKTNATRG